MRVSKTVSVIFVAPLIAIAAYASIPVASIRAASIRAASIRAQGLPTAPAVPIIAGQDAPEWTSRIEIGNGIALKTVGSFFKLLVDPDRSELVRPVCLHFEFLHGVGLMSQTSYMELQPRDGAEAMTFTQTVSRQVVVATDPPTPAITYQVTAQPKAGLSWGTVRGTLDLDISAIELP